MRRVVFESASWKNLNATGAQPITVSFNTHPSTLIVGKNGAGKTTVMDALAWVLFKCPFRRKAVLEDLLNTTNGKAMWAQVNLSVGPTKWRIERGMKPNSIDVWKNGVPLPSENVKDMQRFIEDEILGFDFKTFCQMVALGKHYTPFLELKTGERRTLVENLWNIGIYGEMSQHLKDDLSEVKDVISKINVQLSKLGIKLDGKNERLEDYKNHESIRKAKRQNILDRIDAAEEVYRTALKAVDEAKFDDEGLKELETDLEEANTFYHKLSAEQNTLFKQIRDAEKSNVCPTCGQEIDTGTSEQHVADLKKKYKKVCERYELVVNERENLKIQVQGFEAKQRKLIAAETNASRLEDRLDAVKTELENFDKDDGNVQGDHDALEKEIVSLKKAIETEEQALEAAQEDEALFKQAIEVLKDDGIKAFILSFEIPRMNAIINEFLKKMGLSIKFKMDANFDESIKARGTDDLSYFSFSEGQKQRIDLALLFAWRQMAMEKASLSTNLLFMDEVLDSSMDDEGCIAFVDQIVKNVTEQNNIFIISHRGEAIMNKFDRVLKFELRSGFSKMQEIQIAD